MLRGFRWQLLVLITALLLFAASMLTRVSQSNPTVQTSPTPPRATQQPTAIPTALPTADTTPETTQQNIQSYREALIGRMQRLNPILATLNPVDRDISSLIFEGLTRVNEYGEPVPDLAESWVISSDGVEYVFRLRADVLWQDGMPFTAADVVYTIGLLQSSDFPGAKELGAFWRTVEVQPLDTHLVRFRLTQSFGKFLESLSIGMLPEHALRGTTAAQIAKHPINLNPIGTGPYQLEALRTDGNQIVGVDLRVAPVYRQRPEGQSGLAIERLSFRLYNAFDEALNAFSAGDVDGLAGRDRTERAALLALPGARVHTALEPTLGVLIFNWANEQTRFFREQRVRVGLQTGLDRSLLIDRHLGNMAVRADSPLIPGSWAYLPELPWPTPDVNTAHELLATANLRRGSSEATEEPSPSGILFSFGILVPDDPKLVNLAQEIAAQWSQLNISVSVEAVDQATYESRLDTGDFGAAIVELSLAGSADPDVYPFWDADQYPDGKNYGGVDDRRIAEELERARSESSSINRKIRYERFQLDFIARAIAIPLYYPLFTYVTSTRVEGVQLGFTALPSSRFDTIQSWTISG